MAWELLLARGFCVSDDPARLDHDLIHRHLSTECYWALGRSRAVTEAAIAGSHCFGVYDNGGGGGGQVGFARVVTDHALFAWLGDVFILPAQQGRGLGHALVHAIVSHPQLATVRRMMLVTRDAHGLYRQHGFAAVQDPARVMERRSASSQSDEVPA